MHFFQPKLFVWWFSGLSISHLVLSLSLISVLPTFEARAAVVSVNIAPWLVLESLGLPVTNYGWFTLPNIIGWLWILLVWLCFYYVVAKVIVRLTRRSRGTPQKRGAP